jgi:MFS family permease
LVGAVGTAACLAAVSWLFISGTHSGALVWLFVTYIAFFALSQGAVIWVYIGEVFPNSVRSKGQGVGNASHWVMNTILQLVFPIIVANVSRSAPFTFFAAMTAVQFVVVLLFYPETRGHSLEELQRKLLKA